MRNIFIFALLIPLSGCLQSFICEPPTVNPLVIANCTDIQPPGDDTFGATTYTLIDLAGRYKKCQAAALGAAK